MLSSPVRGAAVARAFPVYLPPGAAAVVTLAPAGCRWPIGEVAEDQFRFCAAPAGIDRYCPAHRVLARRGRR